MTANKKEGAKERTEEREKMRARERERFAYLELSEERETLVFFKDNLRTWNYLHLMLSNSPKIHAQRPV
jgi:hypothetical protein